jgi:hypothetical protein
MPLIPNSVQFAEFAEQLLQRPKPKPPLYIPDLDVRLLAIGTLREVTNDLIIAGNRLSPSPQRKSIERSITVLTNLIAEREADRVGWSFQA